MFGFYFAAVLSLVGFPAITDVKLDFTINLIPFADMISDYKNALLNVLLFIPLGVFLPVLWEKFRDVKSTLLFALCMTLLIEVSQIFTLRTTDINDIITNVLGALLGYFVAKKLTGKFSKHTISKGKTKDLYIICGAAAFIMFLLQPFVSAVLWQMIL